MRAPDWYRHLRPEVRSAVAVEVWRAEASGHADLAWERGAVVAQSAHADLWRAHAVSGRARTWSERCTRARAAVDALAPRWPGVDDEAVRAAYVGWLLGRDDW